jgi:hypothetical protein
MDYVRTGFLAFIGATFSSYLRHRIPLCARTSSALPSNGTSSSSFKIQTGPQSSERCAVRSQTTKNNGYSCHHGQITIHLRQCHCLFSRPHSASPVSTTCASYLTTFASNRYFYAIIKSPVYLSTITGKPAPGFRIEYLLPIHMKATSRADECLESFN